MPPHEALTWALANIVLAESLCDDAALREETADCPELDAEAADLESRLLSCLECRSGGLDPKTPSRTREWLWNGLAGVMVESETE
jgi:hypothetical protein